MVNLNTKIQQTKTYGDMALCNLASINLVEYLKADLEGKNRICKLVIWSLDQAITNGKCPIAEGSISNELYRYIGVGILNSANALAQEGIIIDTLEAAEWFDEVMDDLSCRLLYQSMLLAKKIGPFPEFKNTKWAEGLTPVHMSRMHFPQVWDLTEFGRQFEESGRADKWDDLGAQIKKFGIRHAQVLSIAPTANSGKAINATESAEPVIDMIYKEEGMRNITSLAPNIQQNMDFYKTAFDCNQDNLLLNAIIRQKYLCQAQSITLYLKPNQVNSLKELTRLHNFGFQNGLKTYYYLKQQKHVDLDECVACAI